tara:strand:+ start:155 stop:403 length:249 start_codon:yes stop_codon:yes gene_type:complete
MRTNNRAFGHEYERLFNVGDLVSWNILGKGENYGLIEKIIEKKMGNRNVLIAKIISLADKRHYATLLSSLSIISSVKNHKIL